MWERAWSSQARLAAEVQEQSLCLKKFSVLKHLFFRDFQTWHIVNLLFHWSESHCLDDLFYPNALRITCVLYCNSILYFSVDNNQLETCYCPIHISIRFCLQSPFIFITLWRKANIKLNQTSWKSVCHFLNSFGMLCDRASCALIDLVALEMLPSSHKVSLKSIMQFSA